MTEPAVNLQLASVHIDKALGDRQSEAGAFDGFPCFRPSIKSLKDPLLILGWNARAVVAYFYPDFAVCRAGGQLDQAALGSELNRVANQIHQDLFESRGVCAYVQVGLNLAN